jgi:HEAT repeat protein
LAADYGRETVVAACVELLRGREVAGDFVARLGGPPARWAVEGGPSGPDYWLRVWALRGLLWLWDDVAGSAVISALSEEAWRVREMAAKVVARHALDAALPTVLELRCDEVPRVRQAANRALVKLTAHGG